MLRRIYRWLIGAEDPPFNNQVRKLLVVEKKADSIYERVTPMTSDNVCIKPLTDEDRQAVARVSKERGHRLFRASRMYL